MPTIDRKIWSFSGRTQSESSQPVGTFSSSQVLKASATHRKVLPAISSIPFLKYCAWKYQSNSLEKCHENLRLIAESYRTIRSGGYSHRRADQDRDRGIGLRRVMDFHGGRVAEVQGDGGGGDEAGEGVQSHSENT